MQHARTLRRTFLLGFTLLSACAAGEPQPRAGGIAHMPGGGYAAYLSGAHAIATGDLSYAADRLLAALADDPTNPELRSRAFLACVISGRPEAGRLAKLLPDNGFARLYMANQAIAASDWAGADGLLRGVPRQGSTEILQPLLLAWVQQGGGHTDAALAILRPLVQQSRLRSVFAMHAGLIADLAGRQADAQRFYDIASGTEGAPTLRLAQVIASFEARHGHPAAAESALSDRIVSGEALGLALPALVKASSAPVVRNARDGASEAYLALAAALHLQGSDDFAQLLLRFAMDLRPDSTGARLLMSEIQDSAHQPQAALASLAPIGPTDSLIGVVRLRRAGLLAEAKRDDEAKVELAAMARDYPDRPEPLAEMAAILRSEDRFADAAAAYTQAIDRLRGPEATSWRLFFNRGIAYERAHDWQRAEPDLVRASEMAPNEPSVLNYLAYSWADQGRNLPQAEAMLQKAVAMRPNDGAIIDSLGWVQLRRGDKDGAVATLEHAVELEPEDAVVNGHLGDAYWAVGRKLEAGYQWRRALNLHPAAEDAARLESKLREAGDAPKPAATKQDTTSSLDQPHLQ